MLQNPHRYQHGGHRKTREPGRATRLGARLRCPRAAAGPGRTTSRRTKPTSTTPSPTGEEGAGGSRGRGRASRRGAAGQHRSGSRTIGPGPGSPAGHQATSTSARPQRTRMNITRARQSRPQTHPTRAQQSSPRAHTPLGHNKAAHGHTHHSGTTKPPGPNWGRAAVAVALGFEPRVAVTPHSISSAAPSAARTRYLTRILYYTNPPTTQIDHPRWEQSHTPKPRVRAPTRTSRYAIASNSPRPPRPPRTSGSPGKA